MYTLYTEVSNAILCVNLHQNRPTMYKEEEAFPLSLLVYSGSFYKIFNIFYITTC